MRMSVTASMVAVAVGVRVNAVVQRAVQRSELDRDLRSYVRIRQR